MSSDSIDVGKAGILVIFGTGLGMMSEFLLRIILARGLTADHFGVVVLALVFLNIFSIPCVVGLNHGVVKYIPTMKNTQERNSHITAALIGPIVVSTIFILIGVFTSDFISNFVFGGNIQNGFLYIILLCIPFYSLNKVIGGVLRGMMESTYYVLFNKISRPLLQIVAVSILVYLGASTISVMMGVFFALLLTTLFGFYLISSRGFQVTLPKNNWRSLYRFSLPLMISSSFYMLLLNVDKFTLGIFTAPVIVGRYDVVSTIALFLGIINSGFSFLLYPKISEKVSNGDEELISSLYKQTTKWVLCLTTPFLIVLLFRPAIFISLFGSEYLDQALHLPLAILLLTFFLDAVTGPNGEALLGFGKSDLVFKYNSISVIVNIILNIILIPILGMVGAAIATLIGYSLMNGMKALDLYINHGIQVLGKKPIFATSITTLFLGPVLFFIPEQNSPVIEFMISGTIGTLSLLFILIIIYLTNGVSDSDEQLLRKILSVSKSLITL